VIQQFEINFVCESLQSTESRINETKKKRKNKNKTHLKMMRISA